VQKIRKNELFISSGLFLTWFSQTSESLSTVGVDNFVDKIQKQVKNALKAIN